MSRYKTVTTGCFSYSTRSRIGTLINNFYGGDSEVRMAPISFFDWS